MILNVLYQKGKSENIDKKDMLTIERNLKRKPNSLRNELNLFQVFYKETHRCWQDAYVIYTD